MTTKGRFLHPSIPFAISFLGLPLLWLGAARGGFWILPIFVYGWYLLPILDWFKGRDETNLDPDGSHEDLGYYRLITLIWFPIQFVSIFGMIWYATGASHLEWSDKVALFAGLGVLTGSIGINFSHELMHQKPRLDRWMADLLLASVLYGHFRSEHLLVHHTHVGTPKDAVTARYNEGFWRFFMRVLPGCFRSALWAEANRLTKRGLSPYAASNPFWRYGALAFGALLLSALLGGIEGVMLFGWQAFVAVFQLELINYIEHYGLVRQKREDGRYEPVAPHHSWNSDYAVSNWYLINLQRHSDHHAKPARPFPLLQTYDADTAPQLPAGYAVMTLLAVVPPLFRRIMNPRVRAWRKLHYPDVSEWPRWAR